MNWKQAAWLVAIAGIIMIFPVLGIQQLESGDETRVAGIAAEMFVEGSGWIPKLNGTPFLEYPPLYYWLESGAFALFGIHDFAAKLPAALSAFGCMILVFLYCREMKLAPWSSAAASVFLVTSAQFFGRKTCCTVDMTLAFFFFLSLFGAIGLFRKRPWLWMPLGVLGFTGGIYSKGFLGLVLPLAVLGTWLAWHVWRNHRIPWRAVCILSVEVLVSLLLAGIWYFMVWRDGGAELFRQALFTNNIGRFSGMQGDHAESVFYYFKKLPTLFFPWLPLLFFAFWRAFVFLRKQNDDLPALAVLAVLIPYGILCAASAKRIVYLLPLALPSAVLCAWSLEHLPERLKTALGSFLSGIPVQKTRTVMISGVLAVLVTMSSVDFICSAFQNERKSLRPLFEKCAELERSGSSIVLINASERTRGAAFFYLHHRLEEKNQSEGTVFRQDYGIIRDKNGLFKEKSFADHHYLVKTVCNEKCPVREKHAP